MPYQPIELAKKFFTPLHNLFSPRTDYLLGCFGSFASDEAGRIWSPHDKAYQYFSDMDLLLMLPKSFKLNKKWFWLYRDNFSKQWRIPGIATLFISRKASLQATPSMRNCLLRGTKVLYGDSGLLTSVKSYPGPYGLETIYPLFIESIRSLFSAAILRSILSEWKDAALWFNWKLAKMFHSTGLALAWKDQGTSHAITGLSDYLFRKDYFSLGGFGKYYKSFMAFKLRPRWSRKTPEFQKEKFICLITLFIRWWEVILADYWAKGVQGAAAGEHEFWDYRMHLEKLKMNCRRTKGISHAWCLETLGRYLPGSSLRLFMPEEIFLRFSAL